MFSKSGMLFRIWAVAFRTGFSSILAFISLHLVLEELFHPFAV
jgi:hypothetical protein